MVKSCPSCCRLFAGDAGFCPVCGLELRPAADVPIVANAQDRLVGQLIANRYEVRRIVAEGGMGRVYECRDVQHERRCALKVLHEDVARDVVAVERFKREYEISKLLPHDHIVEVFGFMRLGDGAFALAMEYLDGEELRAVLKRESCIAPARLVRMLSQLAIGLDEAHRRQLIHRDLKPDNIFLCGTHDGDLVKILDFGSVKDKSEGAKKLTVMGTTIGSPYYMSPEQAQGLDSLDARADVWALAAISYECITGTVPFQGSSGPAILLAILTDDPKPPSIASKANRAAYPVPPAIDEVIKRAFAKNLSKRIGNVGALADSIGAAYGLAGDHRTWASTPWQQLQAQIEAALPARMALHAQAPAVAEPDPFGEPLPAGVPPPGFDHCAPETAVPSTQELLAIVNPKSPSARTLLLAGALVVMLLLAAAVLYVLWT